MSCRCLRTVSPAKIPVRLGITVVFSGARLGILVPVGVEITDVPAVCASLSGEDRSPDWNDAAGSWAAAPPVRCGESSEASSLWVSLSYEETRRLPINSSLWFSIDELSPLLFVNLLDLSSIRSSLAAVCLEKAP